jgi:F-type H+-transporting ATPase subunit delta
MTVGTVARRYALATFRLAQDAGALDKIGHDLQGILALLQSAPALWRFFVSPVVDRARKAEILERVLDRRVDRLAVNVLLLLVRKRREALFPVVTTEYDNLVLAERAREPLDIVSAQPLSRSELERMVARLSRVYDKQFEVSTTVDPALLGGVRFTMGDRHIDGSLSGRLDELARELFSKT